CLSARSTAGCRCSKARSWCRSVLARPLPDRAHDFHAHGHAQDLRGDRLRGFAQVHLHRVAVVQARHADARHLRPPGQRGLRRLARRARPRQRGPAHAVASVTLSCSCTTENGLANVSPLPLEPPWSPPAKRSATASRASDVKMSDPLSPPWLKASVEAPSISTWPSKRRFPWS